MSVIEASPIWPVCASGKLRTAEFHGDAERKVKMIRIECVVTHASEVDCVLPAVVAQKIV